MSAVESMWDWEPEGPITLEVHEQREAARLAAEERVRVAREVLILDAHIASLENVIHHLKKDRARLSPPSMFD